MFTIANYNIIKKLYESPNSIVYRGQNCSDNQPAILKRLRSDYPTPGQTARFRREYEITRSLKADGVIQAYSLEPYQNTWVMILEDFGGKSLSDILSLRQLDLTEFLDLAIRITNILAAIHEQNIMHKDINPSNIVWNQKTGQLSIIDFGISTTLSREHPDVLSPDVLEGTLPYISPEQTGRMNCPMDYRTDLYSSGATFYEMLAGRPPFQSEDAMELVHAHIAKMPSALCEVKSDIPHVISEIIMALMSKTADDRYQSASGLKTDLQECLDQIRQTGTLQEFEIRQDDISGKFQIPQKLYGRDQEIKTLLKAFERVSSGVSEITLVTGYAGIGKSSLVSEIRKPIVEKQGYFISGKFDQFKRDIPYSSLIQAFQELVRQILSESEAQVSQWKEKLLNALGPNGQVITDIIPEIRLIIGDQPVVPELPPAETQNRFRLVFQNFVRTFAAPDHPLIIFLDDLQWADSPTLNLIKLLMTDAGMKHTMIIGAYRTEEVEDTHPLVMMLNDLQKNGVPVNTILLTPLKEEHVKELVAETLKHDTEKTTSLAELCYQKTGGNPFFLNQLLLSLYENQLLEFDRRCFWQWDIHKIQQVDITDNVVTLMADKIQKLRKEAQHVLKLAACIGNQFDLKTLAIVSQKTSAETADELWHTLKEGLIVPLDDSYKYVGSNALSGEDREQDIPQSFIPLYRFLHDRVQQAAYSLIEEAHKQGMNLKIGRLMLSNTKKNDLEEKIFDIVNHMNIGKKLIKSQAEKNELAELNLLAGKKAKISAAYELALNYFQVGIELLEKESWQQQYKLTLSLYTETTEAAYLSGHFEDMERFSSVLFKQARVLLDKAKVYEIRVRACTAQSNLSESVQIGQEFLNALGIEFSNTLNESEIIDSFKETQSCLIGKDVEYLLNLPNMTDPSKLSAMRILSSLSVAAYLSLSELYQLITFKQVNLSVRNGNTNDSCFAYAAYGVILCGLLNDIESGYQFGKLSLNLVKQLNAKEYECRTVFIVNCFIKHWKEHFRETLQPFQDSYQRGMETGDLEFSALSAFLYCYYSYYASMELESFEKKIASYGKKIAQLNQKTVLQMHEIYHQSVLNLRGQAENPCLLIGEIYNEKERLPHLFKNNHTSAICHVYSNKLILCYLFQEYNQAVKNAEEAEKYLHGLISSPTIPIFHFYDSLARIAIFKDVSDSDQKNILKKIAANQEKIKKWAHYAPMNYLNKWYLVEAEQARIAGNTVEAMDCYDEAIKLANKNQYINEEALANELAAKFYLTQNKEKIARTYMRDARHCYIRWGATAKVRHLEQTYPELLTASYEKIRTYPMTETYTATQTTRSGDLDMITVIKASQAISGEIVLAELLKKMMKLVMENAGAQQGFLVLKKDDTWSVAAKGSIEENELNIELQSAKIDFEGTDSTIPLLPPALLNRVIRTKEPAVLHDAAQDGDFTNDPYIYSNRPKSVLCLPLLKQDELTGLLYLENNLTTGAFTSGRLELLRIISTQAVISIENASLYNTLDQKVARRTHQLESANKKITKSIQYAEKIQSALLPDTDRVKSYLPRSFFLWMPRDIIGGDIFFTDSFGDSFIIAVIDCTGHGVPGAFMTMLASSALKRIVHDEGCHDPAEILKRLNSTVKTLLKQDTDHALSDDGLEAAVCFVKPGDRILTFAGAGLPLYYVRNNEITVLKGDSQNIGYKRSDINFSFNNHIVILGKGMTFYMSTDGYKDQLGGIRRRRFGINRFEELLKKNSGESFDRQRDSLIQTLNEYKGEYSQTDDVAVAGFCID
ncbi:MAG: AAA family ATPase [Desulfobacteraceae bacterium]|nr:AAA family ATPase [Desulfobacteraceae bacterium]